MPPYFLGPTTSKDLTLAPLLLLKFPPASLERPSDLLPSLVSTPFPSLWRQDPPRIDGDLDLAQLISDSPTACNTYTHRTDGVWDDLDFVALAAILILCGRREIYSPNWLDGLIRNECASRRRI
jgi:hypothetical protein